MKSATVKGRRTAAALAGAVMFLTLVLGLPPEARAFGKEWTRIFNGSAGAGDGAYGVAAAPDGSVYVAGYIGLGGTEGTDMWFRKYSPDGKRQWTRTFSGNDGGWETANGAAAAPDGSVYFIGTKKTTANGFDVWLRKYSSSGKKLWTRTYDGADHGNDRGRAVAVAPGGIVYAAGSEYVDGHGSKGWLAKYSPAGRRKWTRLYENPDSNISYAHGVAVSPTGKVYVAGRTDHETQGVNAWISRYSSKGKEKWSREYNGAYSGWDQADGVAVAPDESVYVAGRTETSLSGYNAWLRKYSLRGKKRWNRQYNGPDNSHDEGNGVAVAPDGSVYVVGFTEVTGQEENCWLAKYSPGGKLQLTRRYDGENDDDIATGVAVAPDGSVYSAGYIYTDTQESDVWLRKYR